MPTYQCMKGHKFIHPAKTTIQALPQEQLDLIKGLIEEAANDTDSLSPEITQLIGLFKVLTKVMGEGTFEKHVCPECRTHNYSEYVESQSNIESVYVHELSTGKQTELDMLLADGYKIVNRYSKQYHLEKPKAEPVQKDLDQIIKDGIADAKAKEVQA